MKQAAISLQQGKYNKKPQESAPIKKLSIKDKRNNFEKYLENAGGIMFKDNNYVGTVSGMKAVGDRLMMIEEFAGCLGRLEKNS